MPAILAAMICPACGHPMSTQAAGRTTVDACVGGCGGIWCDNFEIQHLDDPDNAAAAALLVIPRNPHLKVEMGMKRHCPRCHDQVMRRRFYSRKREVEIDECPACAGVWLDAGELARIRVEAAVASPPNPAGKKR